jgi:hypothetical protein
MVAMSTSQNKVGDNWVINSWGDAVSMMFVFVATKIRIFKQLANISQQNCFLGRYYNKAGG